MATEFKTIQVRRDTAANWTTENPTLAEGEFGYETDTGKLKVGDGAAVWTALDYAVEPGEIAAAIADHEAAPDPHSGYQLESEKGAADGYASLDAGGKVPDAQIPAGIARDVEVVSALSTHEGAADPHPGYLLESLYDASSIVKADSNNTPVALAVPASRLIGRKSSGGIVALTGTEAGEIIGSLAVGTGLQQEGLVLTNGATPATQVTITADSLIVYSATGAPALLTAVNVTAAITASGANGLDTGTEAADTWYHVWVIWNGTTKAALLSTSATAPTMPSGYTHKQRVGAVRNNASSNFVLFRQVGRSVRIEEQQIIKNGGFVSATWTAQNVTAFFPPHARTVVVGFAQTTDTDIGLSHRSDGFGGSYARMASASGTATIGGVFPTARNNILTLHSLYASSLYYYIFNANSTMLAVGWEF